MHTLPLLRIFFFSPSLGYKWVSKTDVLQMSTIGFIDLPGMLRAPNESGIWSCLTIVLGSDTTTDCQWFVSGLLSPNNERLCRHWTRFFLGIFCWIKQCCQVDGRPIMREDRNSGSNYVCHALGPGTLIGLTLDRLEQRRPLLCHHNHKAVWDRNICSGKEAIWLSTFFSFCIHSLI